MVYSSRQEKIGLKNSIICEGGVLFIQNLDNVWIRVLSSTDIGYTAHKLKITDLCYP